MSVSQENRKEDSETVANQSHRIALKKLADLAQNSIKKFINH